MNKAIAPICLSLVGALIAVAQPPAAPAVLPLKSPQAQPPQQPPVEKFWTETDGKAERFDGLVEMLAISRSKTIAPDLMDRIRPIARTWYLELQQQVIDNNDFVDRIEPFDGQPGFFESFDPAQPKNAELNSYFQRQLNGSGPLMNLLEFRRVFDPNQSQGIRRSVYEYDQAMLREVVGTGQDQLAASKHLYRNSYRDAMGIFHRLLDRAAKHMDEAIAGAGLSPDKASELKPLLADVKAAKDAAAARIAVKKVLSKLDVAQRRAVLNRVRDLAPVTDPFSVL